MIRVRSLRQATRRSPAPTRRRRTAPAPPPPAQTPEQAPELKAERRLRASGGPEDVAFYTCGCGFAFQADVSTSVACPHCGAGQAW
jgi:hypothetical protein